MMSKTATYAVVAGLVLLAGAVPGWAALTPTVNTDTALDLDVTWSWNPEATNTNSPTLTNWAVTLTISAVAAGTNDRTVTISGEHLTEPHAGETDAGTMGFGFFFDVSDDFGKLFDSTINVGHPGLNP